MHDLVFLRGSPGDNLIRIAEGRKCLVTESGPCLDQHHICPEQQVSIGSFVALETRSETVNVTYASAYMS